MDRSRKSIANLMDITPEYAVLQRDSGEEKVDPYEVAIGDIIVVRPGEKVPLDGIVIHGSGTVDTSALTGESLPKDVAEGDEIVSGFVNLTGMLKIKVTSAYEDSTVSKILELIESSADKKAPVERFITKFARYYTPVVVFGAAALAVIPPLFFGLPWSTWIYRAMLFLVISCPCALVISVPMAFFSGVGLASRNGVLVKGGNYLEALSRAETVVFDKTGTLTTGNFSVAFEGSGELLELAAHIEYYSNHPISLSIKNAFTGKGAGYILDENRVSDAREIPGKGVVATVDGKVYYAGNTGLIEDLGLSPDVPSEPGTATHIATEDMYLGYILVTDRPKDDARDTISRLKNLGISNICMLTGDTIDMAKKTADNLGIDNYYGQLLPEDKVNAMEKMIDETKGTLVFVGDGINDAPSLARATIGIAMGGAGSQAAIEAADIVIMDDRISKVAGIVEIARKTLSISKINIIFTLFVKFIVLILGAIGLANMWMAVFADVGVSIICILNSMRLLTRHNNPHLH